MWLTKEMTPQQSSAPLQVSKSCWPITHPCQLSPGEEAKNSKLTDKPIDAVVSQWIISSSGKGDDERQIAVEGGFTAGVGTTVDAGTLRRVDSGGEGFDAIADNTVESEVFEDCVEEWPNLGRLGKRQGEGGKDEGDDVGEELHDCCL